ncbi:MAG: tRNA pseudouridine(55) synthase TruB [Bacillota bacterium]|nr:tRNA pseudouridine(55) synthase TruB [Bacillota bacterium]
MNGILVLNKPASFTSMDCCAIVRKIAKEKRVGHTGTLDPNATGVLPICIGKATRLIEYMDECSKTYVAGFRLGFSSDTEDIWGDVKETEIKTEITKELVEEKLKNFLGDIDQIPPMYSAKKVNGQKLYDLARQGQVVERKPNRIHIFRIELKSFDGKDGVLEIECSRGTYVRTICSDLGIALGTNAIMTSLVRTSTCGFTLDDAVILEIVKEQELSNLLLPIDKAMNAYQRIDVDDNAARLLKNGNPEYKKHIPGISKLEKIVAVYNNEKLIAVLKNGKLDKVFNEDF